MNGTGGIIKLVEYEFVSLAIPMLEEAEAQQLFQLHSEKIAIDWPSPRTGNNWVLNSLGWVGFIPLGPGRGVSLQPKVPLANLFEMLEYAYDLRSFRFLDGLFDCESVREFYERLAIILAKRLLERAREGLYKSYREESDELAFVRGRIDILALARSPVKSTISCHFEDQTIDNEDNQIIAWTLHRILRSGICSERSIDTLRKAEKMMQNSVSLKSFQSSDCLERGYNRLNKDYEVLHKLCRFFLDKSGPTQNLGEHSMVPFLVNMARLFELFVARWFKQNLDPRYFLKSQEHFTIGDFGDLKMTMDLVVYDAISRIPLCILDTKYKAVNTVSNDDYNQAVAYADAKGCENAILIYPKAIDRAFNEKPGRVRVKTAVFDLGRDLNASGKVFLETLYSTLDMVAPNSRARI